MHERKRRAAVGGNLVSPHSVRAVVASKILFPQRISRVRNGSHLRSLLECVAVTNRDRSGKRNATIKKSVAWMPKSLVKIAIFVKYPYGK